MKVCNIMPVESGRIGNGLYLVRGSRVGLRYFKGSDADIYSRWLKDPKLRWDVGEQELSAQEVVEKQRGWTKDPFFLELMIDEVSENIPIGDISVKEIYTDHPQLGIMIGDVAYRQGGYGREAVELLFHYARERYDIPYIDSEVYDDNSGSANFHRKLGFESIGFKSEKYNDINRRCLVFRKYL